MVEDALHPPEATAGEHGGFGRRGRRFVDRGRRNGDSFGSRAARPKDSEAGADSKGKLKSKTGANRLVHGRSPALSIAS
jgi:hypothetical protein